MHERIYVQRDETLSVKTLLVQVLSAIVRETFAVGFDHLVPLPFLSLRQHNEFAVILSSVGAFLNNA